MASPPDTLPSTVDETLARCPKFRILVVGNSGVGKSSLISNIFNVDKKDIDIAEGRAGTADIGREYMCDENPRFILHDSQGFEPGVTDNWKTVKDFIAQKCKKSVPVKDRLHAIWMCIETPRTGSRLIQTADEDLIKLANSLNIPVIFVFTKYDLLFNECHKEAAKLVGEQATTASDLQARAAENAATSLKASIKELEQETNQHLSKRFLHLLPKRFQHPSAYVAVSTEDKFPDFLDRLESLTKKTRECLRTKETLVPWAVAQRIDPDQKVTTCIEFQKHVSFFLDSFYAELMIHAEYWRDIGTSTVFKGHILMDCLSRIHIDIVKVWNFKDPEQLLSETEFRVAMVDLIQPFIPQPKSESGLVKMIPVVGALAGIFGPICPPLAAALGAAGLTAVAVKFLYDKYQALPQTALCLEAYIVDLTLVLYDLFVTSMHRERRRPLNWEIILETVQRYKEDKSERMHRLIRDRAPEAQEALSKKKIKVNIGDLIRGELGTSRTAGTGVIVLESRTASLNGH